MPQTHFDRLDAYRVAVEYVAETRPLVLKLRQRDKTMADQLHRAATSIPLNIAEGAGEFSPGDKAKFYRYALRSVAETVAILDVCRAISHLSPDEHGVLRRYATRLLALCTRLTNSTGARKRETP